MKPSITGSYFSHFRTALACVLLLMYCDLGAQPPASLKFQQLSTPQGLSHASVMVTYQDQYGFLWIGTRSGLNRYNGNEITTFLHDPGDTTSIIQDFIFDILQVSNDQLLISTEKGLEVYHYSTNSFTRFPNKRLQGFRVHKMKMDLDSSIWITSENGLHHWSHQELTTYLSDATNLYSISDNYSRNLAIDENHIYLGNVKGLNILDKKTGQFHHLNNNEHPAFILPGEASFAMLLSQKGDVWFGSYDQQDEVFINRYNHYTGEFSQYVAGANGLTLFYALLSIEEDGENLYFGMNGGGLYLFDEEQEWFNHYTHDPKEETSLSDDDVWDIYVDRNHNLWVSTDGGGVNQHHPLFDRFTHTQHKPFDQESLGVNDTHAFYEDNRYVWIGNNTLGLSRQDKTTGKFFNYPFTDDPKKSLLDFTVYAVTGDEENTIWVGSYSGGISKLDPSSGRFTHIVNAPNDTLPLPSNYIRKIVLRERDVWLATAHGVAKINRDTEEVTTIHRTPRNNHFFGDVVNDIAFDADGALWAASIHGLFRVHLKTGIIDSTKTELDSIVIHHMAMDGEDLWLGTEKGLAHYFDDQLEWLTSQDGLSNNQVIGVEVDEQKRVWCITNNGLNLYDPEADQFYSFFLEDGLQSSQFNTGSIYKGPNGTFYAGGLNGYNTWKPSQFSPYRSKPKVVFTDYTIQNGDEVAKHALIQNKSITLHDDDDYLTIEYFSDEIIQQSKSGFSYRLREISKKWVATDDWKISLTNLSWGDHTLDVRAKNYDGYWGEYSTLNIKVLRPVWARSEAFVLYVIILIGLYLYRDNYLKNQRKTLENTVRDRTKQLQEQKEKAEEDKETISLQHEQISKSLTERESLLKEIHHRVKNNLQIIASLLYLQSGKFEDEDFKKVLEEGQGRVRSMALIHQKLYENEDLKSIPFGEYLQELVGEIRASFGMGNIQLNIEAENIHFDVDTAVPLGLIVNEMATNAFKYAFKKEGKGSISIFLTEEDGEYILNIKDDGKGIPEEVDIRKTKSLGLRLVRMLSQQLEGEFEFESVNGTSFQLKFAA